jgi:hypothetical protein
LSFCSARLAEDEATAERYVRSAEMAHNAAMPRVSHHSVNTEQGKLRAVRDRRFDVHQLFYTAARGDQDAVTSLRRMALDYREHGDYQSEWRPGHRPDRCRPPGDHHQRMSGFAAVPGSPEYPLEPFGCECLFRQRPTRCAVLI